MRQLKLHIKNARGFTLIEVLIAALITGIIATASFQFYSKVGHQSEVQYDVSEMQNICRICIYDIRKTLRSAGYMVVGHAPYKISNDTLSVYYSETQPVDTTLFFLQEFSAPDYAEVPGLPTGMKLYYLMKKTNSGAPVIYADFISEIIYDVIDPSNMLITLTSQVPRGDDSFSSNGGFRKFTISERVNMRNVS